MEKNYDAIILYRDGKTVRAVDKRNGRTAEAKCSPSDEFNFITGAKLAFERLTTPKFKVGDIVIGNDLAKRYYITKPGVVCEVVETDVNPIFFCVRNDETMRVSVDGLTYTVCPDCFDLAPEIMEGDIVRVTNTGRNYPYNTGWIVRNITNVRLAALYAHSNLGYPKVKSCDKPFRVLKVAEGLAYITQDNIPIWDNSCYLVGVDGLKLIRKGGTR